MAAPGLSCSMQALQSSLRHVGSQIPNPGPPVLGAWSFSHWVTREVGRIIKFCSLRQFQSYSTVLSTVVTMFYIKSSGHVHLTAECLYALTDLFIFPSLTNLWQLLFYPLFLGNWIFFFFLVDSTCEWYCVCALSLQLCSTHATLWTVAPQASLSMRILQAKILEWVAPARGSARPKDQTSICPSLSVLFCVFGTSVWVSPPLMAPFNGSHQ